MNSLGWITFDGRSKEACRRKLRQYSALDTRLHTFARELEKIKSNLADSQEENGTTFRKENMKLRDEVQA
eukprot:4216321-Amphidinium_carterae.1